MRPSTAAAECAKLQRVESLDGIAEADAHLGRQVPLPQAPMPLVRWIDIRACGPQAVEVCWNLDDTRPHSPGRVALYAGVEPPAGRDLEDATATIEVAAGLTHREAPLAAAQPSLRPVHELWWQRHGLHLRLTAQGPWTLPALITIAQSVA